MIPVAEDLNLFRAFFHITSLAKRVMGERSGSMSMQQCRCCLTWWLKVTSWQFANGADLLIHHDEKLCSYTGKDIKRTCPLSSHSKLRIISRKCVDQFYVILVAI